MTALAKRESKQEQQRTSCVDRLGLTKAVIALAKIYHQSRVSYASYEPVKEPNLPDKKSGKGAHVAGDRYANDNNDYLFRDRRNQDGYPHRRD